MSWNEIQFMLNQGILQYSWASKRFVYIFSPFIRSKWIRGAFYLTTDKGLFITRRQYLSFRKGWLLICYLLSVGTYLWCMMFLNRLEAFLCRNNFFSSTIQNLHALILSFVCTKKKPSEFEKEIINRLSSIGAQMKNLSPMYTIECYCENDCAKYNVQREFYFSSVQIEILFLWNICSIKFYRYWERICTCME